MKRLTALVIVCSVSILAIPFVEAQPKADHPPREVPVTLGFSGIGKFTCLITPDGSEMLCSVRIPLITDAKQVASEVTYKY